MQWLWNFDQAAQRLINVDMHSAWLDVAMRWLTYLGLDQVVVPIIILLIAVPATRRVGLQGMIAYAVAGTAALATKIQFPRLRPGYPGDGTLVAPDEQVFLSSFPSGHTVIVFSLAFTIFLSFPGPRRLPAGIIALSLALLVGISRIYRGIHWPTDVIGSVALAWLAALLAWWLFNRGQAAGQQHPAKELA